MLSLSSLFQKRQTLENHVASTHNTHSLPCIHCGMKFKVKEYLRNHIRKKHPAEFPTTFKKQPPTNAVESKHRCTKCNTCFIEKRNLERHLAAVHGPKNIPCPHCKMMFSLQDYLDKHIKSRHSSSHHHM